MKQKHSFRLRYDNGQAVFLSVDPSLGQTLPVIYCDNQTWDYEFPPILTQRLRSFSKRNEMIQTYCKSKGERVFKFRLVK